MTSVRRPAVAGMFYPDNPMELRSLIETLLKEAEGPSSSIFPIALIAPHAGYIYSGAVAACAYRPVADGPYDTVVILAPSHRYAFEGMAVSNQSLETPLGLAGTDEEAVEFLLQSAPPFLVDASAHMREHSAEVHVPFIQTVLPRAKVVDITIGRVSRGEMERAAECLETLSKRKRILVAASTDLSHFHPYREAKRMDEATLSFIERLDAEGLLAAEQGGNAELCGLCPVAVVSDYARRLGAVRAELLGYSNSGDTAGDKSRVVGYAAFRIDRGGSNE